MDPNQIDANIDFLSSIPSETLQGSGPLGTVYDHQLQLAQVKATVKHHDDDEKWGKSTVITRAKFEREIA